MDARAGLAFTKTLKRAILHVASLCLILLLSILVIFVAKTVPALILILVLTENKGGDAGGARDEESYSDTRLLGFHVLILHFILLKVVELHSEEELGALVGEVEAMMVVEDTKTRETMLDSMLML